MRETGPEWKYVQVVQEKEKGNNTVKCCFCDKVFVSSAYRIRQHLNGEENAVLNIKSCCKVPETVVEEMRKLSKEKQDTKNVKRKQNILDKAISSKVMKTHEGIQQSLHVMFNNKATVDQSVARAFCSAGIPFNVINNYYFKQALSEVAKFGPGYSPPFEFNLRTSLLEKEVRKVSADVKTVVMNDLHTTGGTIVSGGWSNIKNKPIINYILVCTKGDLFLDSTDTSGDEERSKFIANEIIKQINLLGASNIIQVITDSAANCKGSWPLICTEYPHITCGPCTAHCLD